MSKKSGGSVGRGGTGTRMGAVLATAGAVYLARKLITMVWTRVTGKAPPTDPADPTVSLAEALSWAVVAGITIEAARLFATRATMPRPAPGADTEAS